jgi:LysR family transcriptional regulator, glycine cleavage system transcriptional activator
VTIAGAGDLLAGRLARLPFDPAFRVSYAYWIVCPRATADLPKIIAFRDWLVGEAEEDEQRLGANVLPI